MRIAVISCAKYSDCWLPFLKLLNIFWSDHPPVWLVTDQIPDAETETYCTGGVYVYPEDGAESWGRRLAAFAYMRDSPTMIFQEDFLLNAPVYVRLIQHGLEQMEKRKAGMVRLYPCPGANEDYGDEHYGIVKKGSRYRISCQASIWRGDYLRTIAGLCSTAADFEIKGSELSNVLPDEVLAFKRDVQPWPLSYLCSGISRSLWNPDAKKLCDEFGIEVDWSKRGFAAA